MNLYRALELVDGLAEAGGEDLREAWQYIHDSGATATLPGHYGRTVAALISAGELEP
jgi:hypothetical protein